MAKKRTHEEYLKEVYNLVGDEYEVLGEYKDCHTKIEMLHVICNTKYIVQPNRFLQGNRCPNCFGTHKKTTEEFKKEVYNLVGDEYEVLGEYLGTNKYIKIKHCTCNTIYNVTPHMFLQGNRCPECSHGHKLKSQEKFEKEVYNLYNDKFKVIGKYLGNQEKVEIYCNKCNNIFKTIPNNFLKGEACPFCYGNNKKTTEEFKKEVYNLVGDEYEVLGEYINCSTKIKLLHHKCGNIYNVRPNNFLSNGDRCSYCKPISIGEERIIKYLNLNNFIYEHKKKFEDCKNIFELEFDFQVFLDEENFILIEFDGKQHTIDTYNNPENFKKQQKRDQIKNEYCKNKNIRLLRIPYYELNNIENILDKELK